MTKKIDPRLDEQLRKLIHSMGYELVGYDLRPAGKQWVFRLYIDHPQGITIEDCSRVSHQVSALLDVEDPFPGRYALEVSSPGIDRPLFEIQHYQKYIGHRVQIRLYSPINQRKQYKGRLKRVEGENIYLLIDESAQEVALPFSAIEKANLIEDIHLYYRDKT